MKVFHWRYEDGWRDVPEILRRPGRPEREFEEDFEGWHCCAYPSDNKEFEKWMMTNMKGRFECTFRFNSGNPMYTVWIKNPEDATLFKLTWL